MTTLFIQGMRRSGTTILFDALYQDAKIDAWYEPFSVLKGVPGGGSGAQQIDFSAKVQALRDEYCRTVTGPLAVPDAAGPDWFNYGAPRDPALELERELPPACVEFLRWMVERSRAAGATDCLMKFVRLYAKIESLHRFAPDAALVHVVRDPRSVATSQILGKERAREDELSDEKRFFKKRAKGGVWGSHALADLMAQRPEIARAYGIGDVERFADAPDVLRVLLVWRFTFRETYAAGTARFGDRYLLVRHEDLVADPGRELARVYRLLGREADPQVVAWAREHVKPSRPPLLEESDRWRAAFDDAGMADEIALAGYGDLLATRKRFGR